VEFCDQVSGINPQAHKGLETETFKGFVVIDAVINQLYEILREHERVPRLWHALSTMHILMEIVLWQRKHCEMMVEDVLEQFFGVSSTRQSRAKTIFDHRV